MNLPDDYRPYSDKYFLRTKEILETKDMNPYVKCRIFIRKGPGKVEGLKESQELIKKFVPNRSHIKIFSLTDGDTYQPGETIMEIMAPAIDIVALETLYLGIISCRTTMFNDKKEVNLFSVRDKVSQIKHMIGSRPLIYMGARHWIWEDDAAIAKACFEAGADATSTDIGASQNGVDSRGVGTIPHFLENIMSYYFGNRKAVSMATSLFDEVIDKTVPRIALVDYDNHEVDDTMITMDLLKDKLSGIRIDTCGENIMQGSMYNHTDEGFKFGRGVVVTGVESVRRAAGEKLPITLSSGFANPAKVKAFVDYEKARNIRLFNSIGAGALFDSRCATMDIFQVGEDPNNMDYISKAGRDYKISNVRLKRVL